MFDLVHLSNPRYVHLTTETTDADYEEIRRKNPRKFFRALMRFVSHLRSRGILVDQISLFPGPEKDFVTNMNYFFPIKRLHAGTPQPMFISPYQAYGAPKYILTLFPTDEAIIPRTQIKTKQKSKVQFDDPKGGSNKPDDKEKRVSFEVSINKRTFTVMPPLSPQYTLIRESHVEAERQEQELPHKIPQPLVRLDNQGKRWICGFYSKFSI